MLGSARLMIETMVHEFHNPQEVTRWQPYGARRRNDPMGDKGPGRQEQPVVLVNRLVAMVADRKRSRGSRSRAATSCC